MESTSRAVCIQCGQSADDFARLNHLPDGRPCPACAERLLALLPSLLPGVEGGVLPGQEPAPARDSGEASGAAADADYDRPA
jgi:hypothetical protein